MNHIRKGNAPASFECWKQQNPQSNWDAFSGSAEYQDLRGTLVEQQNKMCCYCEIALIKNTEVHVEHFKDRRNHPKEIFNYVNLLASCNSKRNDSCGHKKASGYFNGMVSPLNADCESRFTYTGIGKIIPSDESDTDAQRTIELLGLNCKRLSIRRKAIIKILENADSEYLQQSLDFCVDWHDGFFTVIKYLINKKI